MASSRHDARKDFDVPGRLRLLEGDMDIHEETLKEINAGLRRNNQLLVGILISVTTASILLVINVLTLGNG